jgi:hypothetical protein
VKNTITDATLRFRVGWNHNWFFLSVAVLNSFAPSRISSNFCAGLQTLFKLQVVKSKSNPTQRLGNMMKHMLQRLVIPFICLAHVFQDRMGFTTLDGIFQAKFPERFGKVGLLDGIVFKVEVC